MLLGNLVDNLFLGAVVKSRRRNLLFWTLRQGSKYVATSLSKSTNKALSKDGNNVKPTLAMLECSVNSGHSLPKRNASQDEMLKPTAQQRGLLLRKNCWTLIFLINQVVSQKRKSRNANQRTRQSINRVSFPKRENTFPKNVKLKTWLLISQATSQKQKNIPRCVLENSLPIKLILPQENNLSPKTKSWKTRKSINRVSFPKRENTFPKCKVEKLDT